MKVLHLIDSLHTGGAERLLIDSLPLYGKYGISADLYLLDGRSTPFFHELKDTFRGRIYWSSDCSPYSPRQVTLIRNHIRDHHYDLVHVHLFPAMYWVAILKALHRFPLKLVFTEHNTDNRRVNSLFFRRIDRFIYRQYDAITAITPAVKQMLVEKVGVPEEKVQVIYNGIDLSRFEVKSDILTREPLPRQKAITIIQVSRFSEQKDQDTLIRALLLLDNKYRVIFAGDGPRRSICEEMTVKLGLDDRVQFLGVRSDVPDLLAQSDIVVQSSRWEGFGLAAIEGMAAGKPVIVSDVPGLSDLVNGYGLIFRSGDEQDLANKVKLLEDQKVRDEIVEKCLRRAEEFGIDTMVQNITSLYKRVL